MGGGLTAAPHRSDRRFAPPSLPPAVNGLALPKPFKLWLRLVAKKGAHALFRSSIVFQGSALNPGGSYAVFRSQRKSTICWLAQVRSF